MVRIRSNWRGRCLDIYNLLPQYVVNSQSVSVFQTHVTEMAGVTQWHRGGSEHFLAEPSHDTHPQVGQRTAVT